MENEQDRKVGTVQEAFDQAHKGVLAAQMLAIAAKEIVSELIVDVALLHPNPEKYVASLYDRVSRRIDPLPSEQSEKRAMSEARFVVDHIFRAASQQIARSNQAEGRNDDIHPRE